MSYCLLTRDMQVSADLANDVSLRPADYNHPYIIAHNISAFNSANFKVNQYVYAITNLPLLLFYKMEYLTQINLCV